eukprot:3136194-Prymnesium_polylepis.1
MSLARRPPAASRAAARARSQPHSDPVRSLVASQSPPRARSSRAPTPLAAAPPPRGGAPQLHRTQHAQRPAPRSELGALRVWLW